MLRVMAKQARAEMQGFQSEVRALESALGTGGKAVNGLISTEALTRLSKWGSQLQWAGRQLMYNFTLPVIGAGAKITQWSLANEEAMVRVAKVYGDASDDIDKFARDSEQLGTVFDLLSEKYAVNRAEVVRVAADWAAAGATGATLAKSVETTMKTMVLGEMDAVKSTEALIAIQAQYGLSTEGLIETINILNATENATGTTFQGLVEGMSRSAGVARSAGIDQRHLTAMIAALTPAAGTATQAGNGLKTMISRLLSPTKDAADILELMGMNVQDIDWKSKNGTERLETLAVAFSKLEGAGEGVVSSQAAVVSQYMASRYQINRFDVLMRDILASIDDNIETNGYYGKSLAATSSQVKIAETAQRELNKVLTSSPAEFKRAGVVIQNSLMKAFAPLMPHILNVVQVISELIRKFSELDPRVQKTVFFIAAFAAALGPPLALIGAMGVGIGQLGLMITGGLNAWKKITGFLFGFGEASRAARGASLKVASGAAGPLATARAYDKLTASAALAAKATTAASVVSGAGAALPIPGRTAKAVKAPKAKISFKQEVAEGEALMNRFGLTVAIALKSTLVNVRSGMTAIAMTATAGLGRMSAAATVGSAKIAAAGATASRSAKTAATATAAGWNAASAAVVSGAMRASAAVTPPLSRMNYEIQRTMTVAVPAAFKTGMDRANLAVAQGSLTVNRVMSRSLMDNVRAANAHAVGMGATFSRMWGQITTATVAGAQATSGAVRNMVATNTAAIAAGAQAQTAAAVAGARAQTAAVVAGARAQTAAVVAGARTQGAAAAASLAVGTRAAGRGVVAGIGVILKRLAGMGPALGRILLTVGRFMTGWVGLIITAVVGLVVMFREQIGQVFSNIGKMARDGSSGFGKAWQGIVNIFNQGIGAVHKAFNRLPMGIQNALKAVVNMVASAAKAVYKLFSYMNPFQRHSPSLVENVTNGMRVIGEQFGIGVGNVKKHMLDGYASLKRFGTAVAGFMRQYENLQTQEDRSKINAAFGKSAVASYDMLRSKIPPLKADLDKVNVAIEKQSLVVDTLSRALEAQKLKYEAASKTLEQYESIVTGLEQQMDAAKEALDGFTSAGIKGQREMSDAMFENELAQKKLRLALMDLDKTSTGSLEERLASLRGEIETLQGEKAGLREAGAGGDILADYDRMIADLEAQQDATAESGDEYSRLQDELKKLEKQGERLDLENAIQFDPLIRQVGQLTDGYKELPFDEILAGIKTQQKEINKLEGELTTANRAVEKQKEVVSAAEKAVDKAQASYDSATAGLNSMQEAARMLTDEISALEEALSNLVTAAGAIDEANEARKRAAADKAGGGGAGDGYGAEAFKGAAGGGFADPGGFDTIGDEGGSLDSYIESLMGTMSSLDIFSGIKESWAKFKGWWSSNVVPIWSGLVEGLGEIFGGIDWLKPFRKIGDWFKSSPVVAAVVDWAKRIWVNIKGIWAGIGEGFSSAWDKIKPALERAGEMFGRLGSSAKAAWEGKIGTAIRTVWDILKNVYAFLAGHFMSVWLVITNILKNVVGPAIDYIGGIIAFLIDWISGLITFIVQIITGDFAGAWQTVKDTIQNLMNDIWDIVQSGWDLIVGIFTGIVEGIKDAWDWLYNILVGNSIVPDLINAIFDWFSQLPEKLWTFVQEAVDKVVEWFGNMFTWIWEKLADAGTWLWDKGGEIIDGLWGGIKSIWDNVTGWLGGLGALAVGALAGAGTWLLDKGKDILGGLWDGAKDVWNNVTGWLGGLKDKAVRGVGTATRWLLGKGKDILTGLWNGAKDVWNNVTGWLGGLKDKAVTAVGDAGGWLLQKGKDVLNGLWNGAKDMWTNVTGWLGDLKNKALNAIGNAGAWLLGKGKDVINGLKEGAEKAWDGAKAWFGDLGDKAAKAAGDAGGWLKDKGKAAIDGFGSGLDSGWSTVKGWFGGKPKTDTRVGMDLANITTDVGRKTMDSYKNSMSSSWDSNVDPYLRSRASATQSGVGNVSTSLLQKGKDLMAGFNSGQGSGWSAVSSWLSGVGARSGSAVPGLLGTLVNKGKDLMKGLNNGQTSGWGTPNGWLRGLAGRVQGASTGGTGTLYNNGVSLLKGLYSGLLHQWKIVKKFVSTMAPWIKLNKGPIAADRVLLVDEGKAIMQGLENGMRSQMSSLEGTLGEVTNLMSKEVGKFDAELNTAMNRPGSALADAMSGVSIGPDSIERNATMNTYISFNGDLVLPNIENGQDAQEFIDHLTSFAGE